MQSFKVQTVVSVEANSIAEAVELVQGAIICANRSLVDARKPQRLEMEDVFVKKERG